MRRLPILVAVVLACLGAPAGAAYVTYYFEGVITGTTGSGSGLASASFNGAVTYDPLAPVTPGAGSGQRWTPLDAGALSASVDADSIAGAASPAGVNQTWNVGATTFGITNAHGDWLQFHGPVGSASGALSGFTVLLLSLVDTNHDAGLGSPGDIAPSLLALPLFEHTSFVVFAPDTRSAAFGALRCLSTTRADCTDAPDGPAAAPAPATLALLPLALAALVLTRRRSAKVPFALGV